MNENQKSFLTADEIKTLLDALRKKYIEVNRAIGEDPDERERKDKEFYSLMECATVQDLLIKNDTRDQWDAVSEHFRIPVDVLCVMSARDGDLLFDEWMYTLPSAEFNKFFPLDFEGEQLIADMENKVRRAGGPRKYLEKYIQQKQKQKKPEPEPTPLLPKQKYRQ